MNVTSASTIVHSTPAAKPSQAKPGRPHKGGPRLHTFTIFVYYLNQAWCGVRKVGGTQDSTAYISTMHGTKEDLSGLVRCRIVRAAVQRASRPAATARYK